MFRKLMGIYILFCFLLVRNSPVFMPDTSKQSVSVPERSVHSMFVDEGQESQQTSEENKQLEYADEDLIYLSALNFITTLPLSEKQDGHYIRPIRAAYLSLPSPPPDGNS